MRWEEDGNGARRVMRANTTVNVPAPPVIGRPRSPRECALHTDARLALHAASYRDFDAHRYYYWIVTCLSIDGRPLQREFFRDQRDADREAFRYVTITRRAALVTHRNSCELDITVGVFL